MTTTQDVTLTITTDPVGGDDAMAALRRFEHAAPVGWKATPVGELIEKLDSFDSSDAIAEFFRTEGVRGDRGNPGNCPIQKWLQVMTGQNYQVGAYAVRSSGGQVVAPLPFQAFRFVTEFDGGKYRDLATNNHHPTIKEFDAKHAGLVEAGCYDTLSAALHNYKSKVKVFPW